MVKILWKLLKDYDYFEEDRTIYGLLELEVNGVGLYWEGTLDMDLAVQDYPGFAEGNCENLYAYLNCLKKHVLSLKDGQSVCQLPPYSGIFDTSFSRQGEWVTIRKNRIDFAHHNTTVIGVELEETVPFAELEAEIKRSITQFVKEVGERSSRLKNNKDLLALLDW